MASPHDQDAPVLIAMHSGSGLAAGDMGVISGADTEAGGSSIRPPWGGAAGTRGPAAQSSLLLRRSAWAAPPHGLRAAESSWKSFRPLEQVEPDRLVYGRYQVKRLLQGGQGGLLFFGQ